MPSDKQNAQRIYSARLIEQAKQAALDTENILFDPQGRVLIDVSVSEQDKIVFRDAMGREASPVVTVSLDAMEHPELFEAYKRQYRLNEEQLTQLQDIRGSIIPLQQEFNFHLRLATRTYTAADSQQFSEEQMAQAHQAAMQRLQALLVDEFTNALKKATKNQIIDPVTLLQEQDKSRKTLFALAHSILIEEIVKEAGVLLTRSDLESMDLKHTAEVTTATPNDLLHTDNSLGQIIWIAGSEVTAHDRGLGQEHLADRQILTVALDEAKQGPERLQIRTPSLDVKEGVNEQTAVADIAGKLQQLNYKYNMEETVDKNAQGNQAFTYNLYTAINDGMDDLQGKNKQSAGARIILSGAHQYNKQQLDSGNNVFCFVQNISVNGFGDSLGYGGNSLQNEATLMSEISMLHHLVDDDLLDGCDKYIEQLFEKYVAYLKQPDATRQPFFSDSPEGKDAVELMGKIKAVWSSEHSRPSVRGERTLEQAKGALRALMAHDLHHQHEYAKLTQALSVFTEQASIGGCKSGNERAQAINGRVAVLDSVAHNPDDPIIKAIEALATSGPSMIASRAADLKQRLDAKYDKHLQSAVSLISDVDQGAAAKVNAKVSWFKSIAAQFNRNYAEERSLEHLHQSNAGNMQAHKGLTKRMTSAWEGHPKGLWEYMTSKVGVIGAVLSVIVFPVGIVMAYMHNQYQKDLKEEVGSTLMGASHTAHVRGLSALGVLNGELSEQEDNDSRLDSGFKESLLSKESVAPWRGNVPAKTISGFSTVVQMGEYREKLANGRTRENDPSEDESPTPESKGPK